MAWAAGVSRRATELPRNWQAIRRNILDRDDYTCQIRGPHCTRAATDCDHIAANDDHRPTNLRAACHRCHNERTAQQGQDAMRALRAKAQHPRERHPGLG